MAAKATKVQMTDNGIAPVSDPPILLEGTGTPYLAIFNESGMPVMNKITGIPLGAYVSSFTYTFNEEKENEAIIVFDTGNPDVVDQNDLQADSQIWLQWGYIFSDGTSICNKPRAVKIRDFNATFDDLGTHSTLKCKDGTGDMRRMLPMKAGGDPKEAMSKFLDEGCEMGMGVVIEKFN